MKRAVKSQKRTKFLLVLIVLTAILSITATYAWFSTQRDVEIVGMRLNVEVAESMQISLDGETWTQSITIADMKQFYGTYTGTGDGFTIYQAPAVGTTGNANYVPTELKPVSSAGEITVDDTETTGVNEAGRLKLLTGSLTNAGLSGIALCDETELTGTTAVGDRQTNNEKHPYLVFDMYLRNISAKTGENVDTLKLNAGSNVYINTDTADDSQVEGAGVAGTGLEYSARVGFIVYGNTVSTSAVDDTTTSTDEATGETTTTVTKTVGQKVRELTALGTEVPAIWEPNSANHTAYVVANNSRVSSQTAVVETYALNSNAVGETIADTNATTAKNADEEEMLTNVNTFKPAYTATGVTTATEITDIGGTNKLSLKPNTMSKVRVYVWLEGQDPDCVDLASTGDKLNVTIKLTKDQTTGGTGKPTYAN